MGCGQAKAANDNPNLLTNKTGTGAEQEGTEKNQATPELAAVSDAEKPKPTQLLSTVKDGNENFDENFDKVMGAVKDGAENLPEKVIDAGEQVVVALQDGTVKAEVEAAVEDLGEQVQKVVNDPGKALVAAGETMQEAIAGAAEKAGALREDAPVVPSSNWLFCCGSEKRDMTNAIVDVVDTAKDSGEKVLDVQDSLRDAEELRGEVNEVNNDAEASGEQSKAAEASGEQDGTVKDEVTLNQSEVPEDATKTLVQQS